MGIPLVALQSDAPQLAQVESPIDAQKRALSLRTVLDEQKIKGQTIEENDMALTAQRKSQASQEALQRAYTDSGGDLDKFSKLAPTYGASLEDVSKVQAAFDKHKKDMLDMDEAGFKAITAKNGIISSTLDGITALPEEARQAAWTPAIAGLVKQGALTTQEAQPLGQYPGPDGVKQLSAARKTSEQLVQQATQERAAAAQKATAAHEQAMEIPAAEREFQADYKRYLAANNLQPNAKLELDYKATYDAQKQQEKKAAYSSSQADVDDVAKSIAEGTSSPVLTDYSFRDRTAIAARLRDAGFDQATAQRDYRAIGRFMSTMNGPQQVRMQQSITTASEMLPNIEDLYKEWKQVGGAHGMKSFNKADLAVSKQLPGRAGEVAHLLEAQIADFTADLGTIYKGGNASTDEGLQLAAKNLQGDWNEGTFMRALDQAKKNIGYRKYSILNSTPTGTTPGSPYAPKPAAPATPAAAPSGGANGLPPGWK